MRWDSCTQLRTWWTLADVYACGMYGLAMVKMRHNWLKDFQASLYAYRTLVQQNASLLGTKECGSTPAGIHSYKATAYACMEVSMIIHHATDIQLPVNIVGRVHAAMLYASFHIHGFEKSWGFISSTAVHPIVESFHPFHTFKYFEQRRPMLYSACIFRVVDACSLSYVLKDL